MKSLSLIIRIPTSFLFLGLVLLRNYFYKKGLFKTHSVSVPVISVGNISVGGTGKTLVVEALANWLQSQGKIPAILSRGYGRISKGYILVSQGMGPLVSQEISGDEPFLLALNLKGIAIAVCENRVVGASQLIDDTKCDVILLDDGFQHRRIYRNIDIAIRNSDSKMQHLLPWGTLREPLDSLKRADIVFYIKSKPEWIRDEFYLELKYSSELIQFETEIIDVQSLKGKNIVAFCGIGKPHYFYKALKDLKIQVNHEMTFRDHQQYGNEALETIASLSSDIIITTQKDFIKLPSSFVQKNTVYYLRVNVVLSEKNKILLNSVISDA
jgi:tetraacyldisaccharide 4'-kinase